MKTGFKRRKFEEPRLRRPSEVLRRFVLALLIVQLVVGPAVPVAYAAPMAAEKSESFASSLTSRIFDGAVKVTSFVKSLLPNLSINVALYESGNERNGWQKISLDDQRSRDYETSLFPSASNMGDVLGLEDLKLHVTEDFKDYRTPTEIEVKPLVVERILEREIVSGVSQNDLYNAVNDMRINLTATMEDMSRRSGSRDRQNFIAFSQHMINPQIGLNIVDSTFENITVTGVTGLTDDDIPNSLTLTSILSALTISSAVTASNFTATSTTATSTFPNLATSLIDTSFSEGSVIFSDSDGILTEDNDNFYWDDSNNRLGVGTTSPWARLSIAGASNSTAPLFAVSSSTATATSTAFLIDSQGNVAIGTSSTDSVPLEIYNTDGVNSEIVTRAITDSTLAYAGFSAFAGSSATSSISILAHDPTRTISRYGLTLGGWSEITAGINSTSFPQGLVIGTRDNVPLVFGTNNTERLRVTNDGDVGIGTTTPSANLSINQESGEVGFSIGSSSATNFTVDESGFVGIGTATPDTNLSVIGSAVFSDTTSRIVLRETDTVNTNFGLLVSGGLGVLGRYNDDLTNSANIITLDLNNERVGIGTTSPSNVFHIEAASNTFQEWYKTNGTARRWQVHITDDGYWQLNDQTAVQDRLTVDTSGNVGIGTTSPYASLSVAGQAVAGYFHATTSSATSTFASSILLSDNDLVVNNGGSETFRINSSYQSDSSGAMLFKGAPVISSERNFYLNIDSDDNNGENAFIVGMNSETTVGDTEIFRVSELGRVSVNDGTPASLFSVSATTSLNSEDYLFISRVSDGDIFAVVNSGNTGIGTSSPYAKLSVAGEVVGQYFSATSTSASSSLPLLDISTAISLGSDYITDFTGDGLALDGSSLSLLQSCGDGELLKYSSGSWTCANDVSGGAGGSGLWASSSDDLRIYPADTTDVVLVGTTATSSTDYIFGVTGGSFFNGNVGVSTSTPWANLSVEQGSGEVAFAVGSSSDTRLVVAENGYVGIGTTSPMRPLTVDGNAELAGTRTFLTGTEATNFHYIIRSDPALTRDNIGIRFRNVDQGAVDSTFYDVLTLQGDKAGFGTTTPFARVSVQHNAGETAFFVGSTSQTNLIVAADGNVGVGTTSPWARLSIDRENTGSGPLFVIASTTPSGTSTKFIVTSDGDVGIGTSSPTGDLAIEALGATLFLSATADSQNQIISDSDRSSANANILNQVAEWDGKKVSAIRFATGNDTTNKDDGRIRFFTAPDSATGLINRFGIEEDGEVVVNETGLATDFRVESDNETAMLMVDGSTDRVGVGTTSPAATLHISRDDATGGTEPRVLVRNRSTATHSFATMDIQANDTTVHGSFLADGLGTGGAISGSDVGVGFGAVTNHPLILYTNFSEKARLTAGGNFGIGTTSPYAKLSVVGEAVAEYFSATSSSATSTFAGGFTVDTSLFFADAGADKIAIGTTTVDNTAVLQVEGDVELGGVNSSDFSVKIWDDGQTDRSKDLQFWSHGIVSANDDLYLLFDDNNGGSNKFVVGAGTDDGDTVTEYFRVDSTGNVGVGTSSPYAKLSVAGATVAESFTATSTSATSTLTNLAVTNFFDVSSTATSTFTGNGINLSAGCFAINGTCVSSGGSSEWTDAGSVIYPSEITDSVGVGTTSPWANLAIDHSDGDTPFAIGSSTGTSFVVSESGHVGINTISPSNHLDVTGFINVDSNSGYKQNDSRILYTNSSDNTGVGAGSLASLGGGLRNTAVGANALNALSGGSENVGIGDDALLLVGGGGGNVAIGQNAGASVVGGSDNVFIGRDAGQNVTSSNNVLIGENVASTLTAGASNILIGKDTDVPSASQGNYLNIGDSIYGYLNTDLVGISTTTPNERLHIFSSSAEDAAVAIKIENQASKGSNFVMSSNRSGSAEQLALFRAEWNGNSVSRIRFMSGSDTSNKDDGFITFGTSNDGSSVSERMRITQDGNVGIGTTSPWANLSVEQDAGEIGFAVGSSSGTNFVVAASGNVGIGTDSPGDYALHVADSGVFGAAEVAIESTTNDADTGLRIMGDRDWKIGTNIGGAGTGKFTIYDLTASQSRFIIDTSGNVGIGTTTADAKLTVQGGVCITTGNTCPTEVSGGLTVDTGGSTGGDDPGDVFDLAELYPASEEMAPGDIAAIDTATGKRAVVKKATKGDIAIGIVSSAPAISINGSEVVLGMHDKATSTKPLVALAGRVPVKLDKNVESIEKGDYIGVSDTAGLGRKALPGERYVGIALEDYDNAIDGKDDVLVFVENGVVPGTPVASSDIPEESGDGLFAWLLEPLKKLGVIIKDSTIFADTFVADTIKARRIITEYLQMEDRETGDIWCVTISKGKFRKILGICPEEDFEGDIPPAIEGATEISLPDDDSASEPEATETGPEQETEMEPVVEETNEDQTATSTDEAVTQEESTATSTDETTSPEVTQETTDESETDTATSTEESVAAEETTEPEIQAEEVAEEVTEEVTEELAEETTQEETEVAEEPVEDEPTTTEEESPVEVEEPLQEVVEETSEEETPAEET